MKPCRFFRARATRPGRGPALVATLLLACAGAAADVVQFGWKIAEPPLDGASRIIDWKGQYTNLVTAAYAPNGTYGNFDGLTAAQGPHLDDPVSSLSMTGTQAWADHLNTNGTFETAQHYLGVLEGTEKLDANESVAFGFNAEVALRSIDWQGWSSAAVEMAYAGTTVTNTVNALYSFGGVALAAGDELVVRVLSGETRIAGITVEADAPPAPPEFLSDPIFKGPALRDVLFEGSLAGDAFDVNGDPLTFGDGGGPGWLTIATNGNLTGTPTAGDLGTNTWTVTVDDGTGGSDSATLVIIVVEDLPAPPTPQTAQTNIVFILVDDLGWMDLTVQGSAFYETPNVDRLAGQGLRFTQAYAAHPRCLPSRYGIMTGKFPGANGVPGGSPENNLVPDDPGTPEHEGDFTVGEALQAGGYETCFVGKYHLIGTHAEANLPQNQGFHINISGGKAGAPPTYWFPYRLAGEPEPVDELNGDALFFDNATLPGGTVTDRITGHTYVRTALRGAPGEYVTDRLTDEALDWMTYNADKPMFLYLSHYAVHGPFEAPADLVAKYEAKLATMDYGTLPEYIASGVGEQKMRQDFPTYAAMIEVLDQNIGRVLDRIEELGITSNTVVMLSSDNGGLSNRGGYNTRTLATSNLPLRTGKGWLYEGGIREPLIVRWPGVTATNAVTDAVVNGTDFYPTFLEIAGLPPRTNDHQDGVSFLDALRGLPYDRGEPIFWHSPQARPYATGDFNSTAIREGDYKLIWFYDTPFQACELYDIAADLGEQTNLVDVLPGTAETLLHKIQAWYTNANNVVFRPDVDDVSKPPMPYLDNPGAPLRGADLTGGMVRLSWDNWLGFDYRIMTAADLALGSWTTNVTGITTTEVDLPPRFRWPSTRSNCSCSPSIERRGAAGGSGRAPSFQRGSCRAHRRALAWCRKKSSRGVARSCRGRAQAIRLLPGSRQFNLQPQSFAPKPTRHLLLAAFVYHTHAVLAEKPAGPVQPGAGRLALGPGPPLVEHQVFVHPAARLGGPVLTVQGAGRLVDLTFPEAPHDEFGHRGMAESDVHEVVQVPGLPFLVVGVHVELGNPQIQSERGKPIKHGQRPFRRRQVVASEMSLQPDAVDRRPRGY